MDTSCDYHTTVAVLNAEVYLYSIAVPFEAIVNLILFLNSNIILDDLTNLLCSLALPIFY